MPIRPIGDRFEIESRYPPDQAKARIRARAKGWLDPRDGARGWIVGPIMGFSMSMHNRNGPVLFGCISKHKGGSKIIGRAMDAPGGKIGFILSAIIIQIYITIDSNFDIFSRIYIGFSTLSFAIFSLGLILSMMSNSSAEPLIFFIRESVAPTKKVARPRPEDIKLTKSLVWDIGGSEAAGPTTSDDIYRTFANSEDAEFLILSSAEQDFVQTAASGERFVLEWCDGDRSRFFRAKLKSEKAALGSPAAELFSQDEVTEAFIAFAAGRAMPDYIEWQPQDF